MISLVRTDLQVFCRIGANSLSICGRRYVNSKLLLNSNLKPTTIFRLYSNKNEVKTTKNITKEIAEPERSYLEDILDESEEKPKTTGQKVKRAAETSFYVSAGLASCAVLGGLVYLLVKELVSFSSPNGVYRDAFKRVKKDDRCFELFGEGLRAHGETSGRGRRRHIANQRFEKDGQQRLRIMFHLKGDKANGKVHAEVANIDGKWDYRFLIVECEDQRPHTIVLIDNR